MMRSDGKSKHGWDLDAAMEKARLFREVSARAALNPLLAFTFH